LVQHFGSPCLREEIGHTTTSGTAERATSPDGHLGDDDDEAALPLEGDVIGGCYRLVRRLGEGMFGCVFVAQRTDVPEHQVALKIITRAVYAGRNVERELVMLAAATHPNIVQLKDHGMTDDYVWLTMPLYAGETLAERLDRGPLGLREAYELFLPIVRGVQALHARGLRHQDIKPENIFLAEFADRRHPVLLDLGVAAECNATFVAGTALYGAPEQVVALGGLAGRAHLTERMDTYCLATTLLRSLVGGEHFPGEDARTPFDIANAFEERESAPLRSAVLPTLTGRPRDLLNAALSRWLKTDPAERPSAKQMAEELDVLIEQEREVARDIQRSLNNQKAAYRRIRVALGAFALIGISAVLYVYSKRETLQLASELERAKAEGAESFDKLDTCAAAHQLAAQQTRSCVSSREQDEDRFMQSLTTLMTSNEEAQQAIGQRLETTRVRLNTCESDSGTAAEAWQAERTKLNDTLQTTQAAWHRERIELSNARDTHQKALVQCDANLARLTSGQSQCREDLANCITDRDTCMSNPSDGSQAPTTPVSVPSPATLPLPKEQPMALPTPSDTDSAAQP